MPASSLPARHFVDLSRLRTMACSCLAVLALSCASVGIALAQNNGQASAAEQKAESAFDVMLQSAEAGPKNIVLSNQGSLKLPEGFYFVPKEPASRFMTAVGNTVDNNFYGLVLHDTINGFVSIDFDPAGYIKDDDARDWNAKELLNNLKEGTEVGNKDRASRGIPPIEVIGWVEPPAYEQATHRLVWSVALRDKGSNTPPEEQGVNYNTYLLGREGYLSLNLVTDLAAVEQEKPLARQLLAAVSFNDGKRYTDFNASTDHVAEYGLAALVGGIAAKKLGLLAVIGVFFVKFWKLLAIAVVAFGAGAKKFFGRKKTTTETNIEEAARKNNADQKPFE